MTTAPLQRFNSSSPCPICGGHPELARGKGTRCYGYISSDGRYAHCTREDHAGPLSITPESDTFAHRLDGECNCGQQHSPISARFPSASENGKRAKTLEATYPYLDEHGDLSYQVLRFKYADGDKHFAQRRPNGEGGWIWKVRGLTLLPYRLPELIETPLDEVVYVPEGEKDVDRLISEGLSATCNSGGAGKFHPDLVQWFKGRRVALLGDNDPAGRQHVKEVAALLDGVAESIKVIEFPELPEHGDISDWLDDGHTVNELEELAA